MTQMVKLKSGKMAKVGSRSTAQGGKFVYEVQPDGSMKNITTGRTTSAATQKAPAKPVAKPKAKAAPVPAPRLDRTAAVPKGPTSRGGVRRVTTTETRYNAPESTAIAKPTGPRGRRPVKGKAILDELKASTWNTRLRPTGQEALDELRGSTWKIGK